MKRGAIAVVAALGLVGAVVWVAAGGLELRSDLSFVLPDKASPRTQFLSERLTDRRAQGILMIGISGGAPEDRQVASMKLTETLRRSGLFESVANGGGVALPEGFDLLFDNRYLLGPPWNPGEELSAGNIRQKLTESLPLLGTSAGPMISRYLPSDPTGRGQRILKSAAPMIPPLREGGVWVTGDRKMALAVARAKRGAYDLDAQAELLRDVEAAFTLHSADSQLQLSVGGPARFALETRDRVESNVVILSAVSLALIILLTWGGLRKPALPLLLGLPMAIGVVAGLAAVQAVFGYVHGITLAFGACLVGIAIDYPLHILVHAAGKGGTETAARAIWPTLRLSALSTAVAFVPFILADFPGLSQIGLFVATGLITGLLAARYVFPLLCPSLDRAPLNENALARLWHWSGALRWPFVMIALAGLLLLVARWDAVWESDLQALSPAPAELMQLDRRLRTGLGVPDVRYMITVQGATPDDVLSREEGLRPVLEGMAAEGALQAWRMAADYLPSAAEQTRRRNALPDETALRTVLSAAVEGLPFRTTAFDPFVAAVSKARDSQPISYRDLPEAVAASLVDPYLSEHNGQWAGTVLLSGVARPDQLESELKGAALAGVELLDLKGEANWLVNSFLAESLVWLSISLLVVFGMLYAGLRRIDSVLRIAGSIAVALIVTAGLLSALGIPLSLFHILSLILVAGLGMDYGLFFARRRGGDVTAFRATIFCNLTTASVFLVMAFSTIPVLHGIGLTVAIGSLLALAANAAFAERGSS